MGAIDFLILELRFLEVAFGGVTAFSLLWMAVNYAAAMRRERH